MDHSEPFVFYTEARLVALTGLRASNLEQLLALLAEVPGSSIFYHTHHMYLAHHFETPVFSNDFALWAAQALQEDALAEKLAAIDLLSFTSVRQLREAIIATIEKTVEPGPRRQRECPPGDELHFCRSRSFVIPTDRVARDPRQFFQILPLASNDSIFYHFFEARLRLGRPTNDFSCWLLGRGEEALAEAIDAMDPYASTLDEFKQAIIELGHGRV